MDGMLPPPKAEEFFFHLVVAGRPQGKALKARMAGKHAKIALTNNTAKEMAVLRESARIKMGDRAPHEGPLIAEVWAYKQTPTSFSKAKAAAAVRGEVAPTSKPDCDNLQKSIGDSLNGIVYRDDAQIVDLHVYKRFSATARTVITLRSFTGDP